jgi:hypothetical protein
MNEPPAVAAPALRAPVPVDLEPDPPAPGPGDASGAAAPADPVAPVGAPTALDRALARLLGVRVESWVTLVLVVASMAWIFSVMHPSLVFADTTPTGGDMGAHVWAPAYLRDHLLPKGRLIGWTPDWYAGFPAFQYYMILPSLAVVLLNVGLAAWQAVLVVLAAAAAVTMAFRGAPWPALRRWRGLVAALAGFAVVCSIGMSYGVAFKLVVISGLVTMPLNAWALGRLVRLPFPGPVLLALATLPFVFDRSFNIYGGNVASTMAGEFAFSMGLSLSLLAIGCTIRALDTGAGRGWAALTLALTGLCHLFPAFFALGVVLVYAALRFGRTQLRVLLAVLPVGGALGAFWALPFFAKRTYMNDMGWGKVFEFKENLLTRNKLPSDFLKDSPPLEIVIALAIVGVVFSIWRRNRLGIALGVAAGVVALAFIHRPPGRLWNGRMLPFYYLCLYLLAALALAEAVQFVRERRWARWFAGYALLGLVVAELVRALVAHTSFEARIGRVLPGVHASVAGAFLVGLLATVLWTRRGWAAPLLSVGCTLVWLASIEVPEPWWTRAHGAHGFVGVLGESVARPAAYAIVHALTFPVAYVLFGMVLLGFVDLVRDTDFVADGRTARALQLASAPAAFLLVFVALAPALRSVPGGQVLADGRYEWGLPGWKHATRDVSYLPSWSKWNFSGYERKPASGTSGGYPEFYDLVQMVETVGQDPQYGCGRSMWEYGPRLEGYGTPMAPMLLPHFTDGCIGSMEGLYFEASSTTPYHFLNQSALSKQPSSAQRDLPYPGFDLDLGIQQLQLMGVRYYLAFSDTAVAAAQQHPDLREIATAGVWHMFLVDRSELVEPLTAEPVVYANVGETQAEWLQPAAHFFEQPALWDVLRAASGPASWARLTVPETAKMSDAEFNKAQTAATAAGRTLESPTVPVPETKPLPAITVTAIRTTDDTITFDVDQVGVPVLVKSSYFPNWKASGADGPYRVTPNLMVVVPTSTHVELHYGYTGVDLFSMLLTLAGLIALVVLFKAAPEPVEAAWFDPLGALGRWSTARRTRAVELDEAARHALDADRPADRDVGPDAGAGAGVGPEPPGDGAPPAG